MQSVNTAADLTDAAFAPRSASLSSAASPEFLERFLDACASAPVTAAAAEAKRELPQPSHTELRFDHFMRLALYDETVGYYAQPGRHRVGRSPGTDFYTSSNVGQNPNNTGATSPGLFGELVVQSCLALMGEAFCARATFIEIGAECGGQCPPPNSARARWPASLRADNVQGILENLDHPFAAARTISLGEPIQLSSDLGQSDAPLIVFSNELFDAQPCRRFVWREGGKACSQQNADATGWRETYVRAEGGTLSEVEHPLEYVPKFLPKTAPDGYRIDAPLDSKRFLDQIAQQPWHGLFLAFDYGKTWAELTEATPQGTARAYTLHRQINELLDQPGQQDLTCHICWDWLQDSLAKSGFGDIALDTQEAFFVKHAGSFIAQQIAAEAHTLSPKKQALLQLLHPAHLGQKFQVLSATRTRHG